MDFLTEVSKTVYGEVLRTEVRAFYRELPEGVLRIREGFRSCVLERVIWNEPRYKLAPIVQGRLAAWMSVRDIASQCDGLWSFEDIAVTIYAIIRDSKEPGRESGGMFLSRGYYTSLYYDPRTEWTVWTHAIVTGVPAFFPPRTKFLW